MIRPEVAPPIAAPVPEPIPAASITGIKPTNPIVAAAIPTPPNNAPPP